MKSSELRKLLEWCENRYGDLPVTDRKLLQFNVVDMIQDCNGEYLCFKLMDRDYTDPMVSANESE